MRHPNHMPPNMPIISLREPRTCNELGVCQHPVQCTGRTCYRDIVTPEYSTALMSTEAGNYWPDIGPARQPDQRQTPRTPDNEPAPAIGSAFDEFTFWACCFAAYAAIFAVLGYLWGRHGDKIKAALASLFA